jgi:hypothetical protein
MQYNLQVFIKIVFCDKTIIKDDIHLSKANNKNKKSTCFLFEQELELQLLGWV